MQDRHRLDVLTRNLQQALAVRGEQPVAVRGHHPGVDHPLELEGRRRARREFPQAVSSFLQPRSAGRVLVVQHSHVPPSRRSTRHGVTIVAAYRSHGQPENPARNTSMLFTFSLRTRGTSGSSLFGVGVSPWVSSSGEGMLRKPGPGGAAARCRKAGKIRMKGKGYFMKDGDIVEFREGGPSGSAEE